MIFLYQMQGTNQQQDTRFSDKEKKLLKQMKFGDCLNKKVCDGCSPLTITSQSVCRYSINTFCVPYMFQVDMSKVRLDVLRPWISKKITEFLHIEDDVVVEFVYNQLEEKNVSEKQVKRSCCVSIFLTFSLFFVFCFFF